MSHNWRDQKRLSPGDWDADVETRTLEQRLRDRSRYPCNAQEASR